MLDKLDEAHNETLNSTTLVDALLVPVKKLKERVLLWVYLPFLLQSVLCILYFSDKLAEKEPINTIYSTIEGTGIIALSGYFLWLEYLQFSDGKEDDNERLRDRIVKYFAEEATNYVELLSSILNTFLVLNESFGRWIDGENLKLLALAATIFIWFKNFYWMRLFEKPAFFMNLLIKTLHGVIPFTVFLTLLILAISNVLYLVDKVDNND